MQDKVVVLVEENPANATFKEVTRALGLTGIDPLDFIEPESHMLSTIYRDIFTSELANELMGYLVHKQPTLLVWDIINRVHLNDERLVIVNTTLLSEEDVRFLVETLDHTLSYALEASPERSARDIYDGSKSYRDEVSI